jgi:hypothetical protein
MKKKTWAGMRVKTVLKRVRDLRSFRTVCPPQPVPPRRRSVYGLVSGTFRPSRLPTPIAQWHQDLDYLTYRCGGSAGLNPVAFYRLPVSPLGRAGQRTPERALSLPPNQFSVKFGGIHPLCHC